MVPGLRVEVGPVINLGQSWSSSDVHIGIQIAVSLSLAARVKIKCSFWHAISTQLTQLNIQDFNQLLLCIVQRASVRVRKVPEVSVFLTIKVSVIEEGGAVVNLLSKPSNMDLAVAELVECELVVDICFNKSVSVEVEAGHPNKHFEHGDVVLLNLNLQR